MKPLNEYAPFKIGERFEDSVGNVLEFYSSNTFKWVKVGGVRVETGPHNVFLLGDGIYVKPLDRTSEALDELAQLDAKEICGPKPWRDMTDDEKAPILLAWADGKSIEWWDEYEGEWCDVVNGPQSWNELAYRIAPEDVCKEPREFWLCESTYEPFTKKPPYGNYIHVREVTQ